MSVGSVDCTKYPRLCEQLSVEGSQTIYYEGPPARAVTRLPIDSLTPKEIATRVLHQLPEDTVLDDDGFLVRVLHRGLFWVTTLSD